METKKINPKKLANSLKRKYEDKIERRLKDMKNRYQNKEQAKKILKKKNPLIYKVYIRKINENLLAGLTIMNSGTIGNEYYMTKGHKHKKPLPEIYILIKGKAKLILQNKKTRIINLKKGKRTKIPAKSAHRLINIGNKKTEVLTIYSKKAGKGYGVKFKKRIFKNNNSSNQ